MRRISETNSILILKIRSFNFSNDKMDLVQLARWIQARLREYFPVGNKQCEVQRFGVRLDTHACEKSRGDCALLPCTLASSDVLSNFRIVTFNLGSAGVWYFLQSGDDYLQRGRKKKLLISHLKLINTFKFNCRQIAPKTRASKQIGETINKSSWKCGVLRSRDLYTICMTIRVQQMY